MQRTNWHLFKLIIHILINSFIHLVINFISKWLYWIIIKWKNIFENVSRAHTFIYIYIIHFTCIFESNIDKDFITFFYIHKKKILDSRKFSTSGFRCIHMFWDVLNSISPFLENVCLSTKFFGHCISRTNARKLMENMEIKLKSYKQ